MDTFALKSRDYLDEAFRIAKGQRSDFGLPIIPDEDHIQALYLENQRLHQKIKALEASIMDDEQNLKEVQVHLGKVSP